MAEPVIIGRVYLFLRAHRDGWVGATFGILLVAGVLIGDAIGFGVRRRNSNWAVRCR